MGGVIERRTSNAKGGVLVLGNVVVIKWYNII